MNIGGATENSKMVEGWFPSIPGFKRCSVVESGGRTSILEIHDSLRNFRSELLGKFGVMNNGADSTHDCSISTFCDAILVGVVRWSDFLLNPLLLEILVDMEFVFRAAVSSKSLDFRTEIPFERTGEKFEVF